MLDMDELTYKLLRRTLDGIGPTLSTPAEIDLKPDLEADAFEHIPLVTFTITGGQALDGSTSPPKAWEATLSITVIGEGLDATREIAGRIYDGVWLWDDPWKPDGLYEGIGHATEIDDQSLFTRTFDGVMDERSVTQMDAVFGLQLHAE